MAAEREKAWQRLMLAKEFIEDNGLDLHGEMHYDPELELGHQHTYLYTVTNRYMRLTDDEMPLISGTAPTMEGAVDTFKDTAQAKADAYARHHSDIHGQLAVLIGVIIGARVP